MGASLGEGVLGMRKSKGKMKMRRGRRLCSRWGVWTKVDVEKVALFCSRLMELRTSGVRIKFDEFGKEFRALRPSIRRCKNPFKTSSPRYISPNIIPPKYVGHWSVLLTHSFKSQPIVLKTHSQ
jgi:hypothetical protein